MKGESKLNEDAPPLSTASSPAVSTAHGIGRSPRALCWLPRSRSVLCRHRGIAARSGCDAPVWAYGRVGCGTRGFLQTLAVLNVLLIRAACSRQAITLTG